MYKERYRDICIVINIVIIYIGVKSEATTHSEFTVVANGSSVMGT